AYQGDGIGRGGCSVLCCSPLAVAVAAFTGACSSESRTGASRYRAGPTTPSRPVYSQCAEEELRAMPTGVAAPPAESPEEVSTSNDESQGGNEPHGGEQAQPQTVEAPVEIQVLSSVAAGEAGPVEAPAEGNGDVEIGGMEGTTEEEVAMDDGAEEEAAREDGTGEDVGMEDVAGEAGEEEEDVRYEDWLEDVEYASESEEYGEEEETDYIPNGSETSEGDKAPRRPGPREVGEMWVDCYADLYQCRG
ncbi:hypothetical protein KEM55_004083, partial [Ascosphaera atra]